MQKVSSLRVNQEERHGSSRASKDIRPGGHDSATRVANDTRSLALSAHEQISEQRQKLRSREPHPLPVGVGMHAGYNSRSRRDVELPPRA